MSVCFYPEHNLRNAYSSPRDRYLEALAQAEAAKADYEASVYREAEFARRQRARDAYILQEQQRRRDLQSRRVAFAEYDDEDYGYQPHGYRGYSYARGPFNPHRFNHNRLLEQERERQHAHFIAEERARIRAEVEAAVKAKADREAEARAAHLKAKREREQAMRSQPNVQGELVTLDQVLKHFLGGLSEDERQPRKSCATQCPRKLTQRPNACGSQACQRSIAPQNVCPSRSAVADQSPSKTSEEGASPETAGLEQVLSLIFGTPVKVTKAGSEPTEAESSKAAVANQPAAPPASASKPTPVASTSSEPAPVNLGSLKDLLITRLGSEPEAEVREALQGLFGSIFSHQQGRKSPSPSTASTSKSQGSLKEQLEARLRREHDAEARDIELAIAESLKTPSASPSSSKGKSAAVAETPASSTPAAALASINDIEAQFKSLAAAFEFPDKLDISPPSSPGAYTTSTLSRLAFTAANAPVRYYEQALSGLLSRLDAIESSGDEEVRHRRKEVVNAVETALEEVEREVETRAAMISARDSSRSGSVPIIAEPVAPKQTQEEEVAGAVPSVEESLAAPTEEVANASVNVPAEPIVDDKSSPLSEEVEIVPAEIKDSAAIETENAVSTVEAPSYPPSVSDSNATITADPVAEEQEPFLLSKPEPEVVKVPAHTDVDEEPVVIGDGAGSDWSEVEA